MKLSTPYLKGLTTAKPSIEKRIKKFRPVPFSIKAPAISKCVISNKQSSIATVCYFDFFNKKKSEIKAKSSIDI
jgi:hypothetical protein